MTECDNCGSHVTKGYHRVLSDNDGILHGCTQCSNNAGGFRSDDDGDAEAVAETEATND